MGGGGRVLEGVYKGHFRALQVFTGFRVSEYVFFVVSQVVDWLWFMRLLRGFPGVYLKLSLPFIPWPSALRRRYCSRLQLYHRTLPLQQRRRSHDSACQRMLDEWKNR